MRKQQKAGINEVKVPALSKDDTEKLFELFQSADKLTKVNGELYLIVQEEVQSYFLDQQSLDKVVKYVDNRVNTYLQENQVVPLGEQAHCANRRKIV